MGGVLREEGVLKLVHPGGFVEVHREPVAAAQVMEDNPRHCVTRPDVFKFPWIVVRPESLLKPGRVYFIVPNRTIYRLARPDPAGGTLDPRGRQLSPPSPPPKRQSSSTHHVPNNFSGEGVFEKNVVDAPHPPLKSCLKKKHTDVRSKPRGRRVNFVLPEDEDHCHHHHHHHHDVEEIWLASYYYCGAGGGGF